MYTRLPAQEAREDLLHATIPQFETQSAASEFEEEFSKQRQAGSLRRIFPFSEMNGDTGSFSGDLSFKARPLPESAIVLRRYDLPESQSETSHERSAHLNEKTGLPEELKTGIEALSGLSLDDVRVHYNSSKPAQILAHAYAKGTEIHLAPGQEAHLPHEAWHVVQQKQGRVRGGNSIKGMFINFEAELEAEADRMGEKANRIKSLHTRSEGFNHNDARSIQSSNSAHTNPVQPRLIIKSGELKGWYSQEQLTQFLDGIAKIINLNNLVVVRGPREIILDEKDYTIDTIWEMIRYMTEPDHDLQFEEFEHRKQSIQLEFDDKHGSLHFTGKVIPKKAQWTITKDEAQKLMEAEIRKHMATLMAGSHAKGWTPWYIGKDTGKVIGESVSGPETKFTIQLQVNKELGNISYHGYPDQRLLGEGVGRSKKSLE